MHVTQIEHLITNLPITQDIMSISGESGIGKTTLGLQIAGYFLTYNITYIQQCIRIQESELFLKKRLISLYHNNIQRLNYLKSNILVFPRNGCFATYESQRLGLTSISQQLLPPHVKVIIIDNIYLHLRYWLNQREELSIRGKILNEYFTDQLFPLIMRCKREEICLILIHEVSYNVKEEKVKTFFSLLYKRSYMLRINLSKSIESLLKRMEIKNTNSNFYFQKTFELSRNGYVLL